METLRHPARALPWALVFLTAAATCLWAIAQDQTGWVLASKWVPAIVLAAFAATRSKRGLHRLLASALLVCGVGDATLEGSYIAPDSDTPWFAIGLGCFLVAHLLLVGVFLQLPQRARRWPLPAFAAFAVPFYVALHPHLGALHLPVAVYILVIGLMVWRASRVLSPHGPAWMVIAGALLFAGSDSMIAINRFIAPFEAARTLILLSYWAALILITFGTLRATPRRNPITR